MLARAPRGQAMVLMAGSMIILLAMAGVVYDVGYAWITRQEMQDAADAAAKAGANEVANQDTTSVVNAGKYDATKNGFTQGSTTNGVTVNSVAVNTPPTAGPYAGKDGYVEAIISATVSTSFLKVLGYTSFPMIARATAKPNPVPICVQSLDGFGHHAMVIGNGQTTGDVTINATQCDVYSDSNNNDPIGTHGGSCMNTLATYSAGGFQDDGDCVTPLPVHQDAPPVQDLLSGTTSPGLTGPTISTVATVITGNKTLSPGIYTGGIMTCALSTCTTASNPSAPTTIHFNDGLYVINGGGLNIGTPYTASATTGKSTAGNCGGYSPSGMSGIAPVGTANVTMTGSNVTFYITGTSATFKPVRVLATSGSSLSAPTTSGGSNIEGILFFQDRSVGACSQNIIQGGTYTGTLYFAPSVLGFGGTGGSYNYFIADQLQFTTNLTINTDYSSLADGGVVKLGSALAE